MEISLTKIWRGRTKDIYKDKQENACSQSHDVTSHCQWTHKILTFYLQKLMWNLLRKITVLLHGEKEQITNKRRKTGQSWLSIPRYNLLLLFCLPNMNFLSYKVTKISLTKNVERKKNRHIQERINRKMPVLHPTMQQVNVNIHTKY